MGGDPHQPKDDDTFARLVSQGPWGEGGGVFAAAGQ